MILKKVDDITDDEALYFLDEEEKKKINKEIIMALSLLYSEFMDVARQYYPFVFQVGKEYGASKYKNKNYKMTDKDKKEIERLIDKKVKKYANNFINKDLLKEIEILIEEGYENEEKFAEKLDEKITTFKWRIPLYAVVAQKYAFNSGLFSGAGEEIEGGVWTLSWFHDHCPSCLANEGKYFTKEEFEDEETICNGQCHCHLEPSK